MTTADKPTTEACYRHPKRVSYVLCQRCARTVCTECQQPAPVGVLCGECAKPQRPRNAPSPLRLASRRVRSGIERGAPVATYTIMALTTVVSVIGFLVPRVLDNLAYSNTVMGSPYFWEVWWTPLTHGLAHLGFLHLFFNMMMLWFFGRELERVFGTPRFIVLYLFSAIAAALVTSLIGQPMSMAGASGSIFGLLGAFLLVLRRSRASVVPLLVLVGINFGYGLFVANVAWQGHLGGFLGGLIIGGLFVGLGDRRTNVALVLGAFGCAALYLLIPVIPFPH